MQISRWLPGPPSEHPALPRFSSVLEFLPGIPPKDGNPPGAAGVSRRPSSHGGAPPAENTSTLRVLRGDAETLSKGSFHIFVPLPITRLVPGSFILHLIRCQLQRAQLMNSPMGYKRVTAMCKITIMILGVCADINRRRKRVPVSSDRNAPHVLTGSGQQGGAQTPTSEGL